MVANSKTPLEVLELLWQLYGDEAATNLQIFFIVQQADKGLDGINYNFRNEKSHTTENDTNMSLTQVKVTLIIQIHGKGIACILLNLIAAE